MATIDELQVLITAETGKLKKELAGVSGDLDNMGKQAGIAGQSFQKFASIAKVGALAAGAAMATGFGMAVKATAEFEQNVGGALAVFGDWSLDVEQMAVEAYKNMGLSASDYLATINKMGSLLKGAGYSNADSFDMSSKAMQRASDIASIMGVDVGFAMESIAGAAKGNFTMMDNLGVAMNDTTLNAYALEKGISKTTQQMTNAEKVGLAMEMFLDRTAYAAGNYVKENETLAGSFTTLKGSFKNFLSGVEGSGPAMAESLSQMTRVLSERLPQIASTLASSLHEMLVALLGNVNWADVYAMIIPSESIRTGIATIFSSLSGAVTSAWAVIKPVAEWFEAELWPVLKQVGDYVRGQLKSAWDSLTKAFQDIAPAMKVVGAIVGGVLVAALVVLVSGIAAVIAIAATLINWIVKLGGIIISVAKAIVGAIGTVASGFGNAWGRISAIWSGVPGWFSGVGNGIVNALSGIPGKFSAIFRNAVSAIKNIDWTGIGRDIIMGIGRGIAGMGGWLADQAIAAVGGAKDALKGFLGIKSPSRVMRDEIGKMLGLGIAEGIDSSAKYAFNSMRGLSDSLVTSIDTPKTAGMGNELVSKIQKSDNIPVNIQIDGETLLSFVIDGVNGKSFLSNDSVIYS